MTLYQSPAATWAQDRTWLPAVAHSIVVTNPRQVAGADRVVLPRNNPLDNSGLIESWRGAAIKRRNGCEESVGPNGG